jgi:hypothetical protein
VNFARAICDGKCFLCTKIAAGTSGCHNRIVRQGKIFWLRGRDLNPRPSGYEPDELPGCSTPHFDDNFDIDVVQIEKAFVRRQRGELAILFAFAAVCDFVDG